MQANDKIKIKDAVKINLRGFKIWMDANPKIFISSALCAVFEALTPYVGIYLSALILDELAGARDIERLTRLALTALFSAAFLTMLNAGLSRWKHCQNAGAFHQENHIYNRKQ
jgi:ATP-binding cassette subfamily B protein